MKMSKAFLAAIISFALVFSAYGATLLPNGKQQFIGQTGSPLAGGSVTFYVPGTTTPKTTWLDANQTQTNPNPVPLDSLGSARIYGNGSYRQIVRDISGNIIWDQLTSDTSAGGSVLTWGGISGGSANAQTITSNSFTSTDGQSIGFVAGFTNTGAATITNAGGSALSILKTTPAGPQPLSSGDIVAGNVIQVTYVSVLGSFVADLASASSVATGTVVDFAGSSAPAGWLLTSGQAISRSTYAGLFVVLGVQYGAGDGTTTFNVPDLRGRVVAGFDNMGGTNALRLSNFTSNVPGAAFGIQVNNLTADQNGPHAHPMSISDPGHNHGINISDPGHSHTSSSSLITSNQSVNFGINAVIPFGYTAGSVSPSLTGISATAVPSLSGITVTAGVTGTGANIGNVQPTMVMNKIIKF